jgi:outer membrane protein TolC
LIEKTKEYHLSNANKGYLPQLLLTAKATYQSDVTRIPIDFPGITGLNKNQYGVTLEISQTLFDGGVIHSQRNSVKAASSVEEKETEVSLYSLNERINQLYFSVLLLDEKLNLNNLLREELQRNYNQISAYVQNGMAHSADLDAVMVEQLKLNQNNEQLTHPRRAYLEMLFALLGENLPPDMKLQKPDVANQFVITLVTRPELDLFEARLKSLDTSEQGITAGLLPKLGLFVTGGYGRPGLNMLDNDFAFYYVGGIRLTWNFGNLYTQKNNRGIIAINKNRIFAQRDAFLVNTTIDIAKHTNEINKIKAMIQYDDEIIRLQNSIKQSAQAKVAGGTFSVTDWMREINAEDRAKQDKVLHETELMMTVYELKFTTNH